MIYYMCIYISRLFHNECFIYLVPDYFERRNLYVFFWISSPPDVLADDAAGSLWTFSSDCSFWRQCPEEPFCCKIGFAAEDNDKSYKNQHQMPENTMKCQCPVRMENAGGVDKGGNSSHHIEIKQKGTENSVPFFIMHQNQQWTQIQRKTA